MARKEKPQKDFYTEEHIRELFPVAAEEKRIPTQRELKAAVTKLNEAEQKDEALTVLKWHQEYTDATTRKLNTPTKFLILIMAVAAVGLGILWLMETQTTNSSSSLVVCSINGVDYSGDDCKPENVEKKQPKLNENKDSKETEILIGQP